MKVLLTGATGLLGQDVCRELHDSGLEVVATDRNRAVDLPVPVKVADVLDYLKCYELLEGVQAVVHLAAYPNDNGGVPPQILLNENLAMLVNLLRAAHESGVKRFIFASSVQAMAARRNDDETGSISPSQLDYLPADGKMAARANTHYGMSKKIGEEILAFYTREYGMHGVAIRFPHLISARHFDYYRERYNRGGAGRTSGGRRSRRRIPNLDECFTCLSTRDAGRLIAAILERDLEGYRCYFPTAPTPSIGLPVAQLIADYYPNVELRKPIGEMSHLVDISKIVEETGWQPLDDLAKTLRAPKQ